MITPTRHILAVHFVAAQDTAVILFDDGTFGREKAIAPKWQAVMEALVEGRRKRATNAEIADKVGAIIRQRPGRR